MMTMMNVRLCFAIFLLATLASASCDRATAPKL